MSGSGTGQESGIAKLVDELEDVQPEDVRTKVLEFATEAPPPISEDKASLRDLVLPGFAFLLTILAIAAVLVGSLVGFNDRIRRAEEEARGFLTGEGLVLAEFRRQTEEQLEEKDRTIIAALARLRTLETERRELDQLVEVRVRQREQELVAELQERLGAERARLESSGADADAAEAHLEQLRSDLAQGMAEELSRYRLNVEQELRARASELQSQAADARAALELASVERSEFLEQASSAGRSFLRDGGLTPTTPPSDESPAAATGDAPQREGVAELPRTGDTAREVETELRAQIARLTRELEAARSSTEPNESRMGTVAEQARTQALRDVLELVRAYEVGADTSEFSRLLSVTAPDRAIAGQLGEELARLIVAAQRAVLDAQMEFRPLGTVALVGAESITVQRLVTLEIRDGMLAEIRAGSSGGDTAVVARGTVSEVGPQRFTVQIAEQPGQPEVGDRVFVAVPRQR